MFFAINKKKKEIFFLVIFTSILILVPLASAEINIKQTNSPVFQGEKLEAELNYSTENKQKLNLNIQGFEKEEINVKGEGTERISWDTTNKEIGDYELKAVLGEESDTETITVAPRVEDTASEFEGSWQTVFKESFELAAVLFMDMMGSDTDYDNYFKEEAEFFPRFLPFVACKAEPFIEQEYDFCHVFSDVSISNFPKSLLKIEMEKIHSSKNN